MPVAPAAAHPARGFAPPGAAAPPAPGPRPAPALRPTAWVAALGLWAGAALAQTPAVVPSAEQLAPRPALRTDSEQLPPRPLPPRELEKPQDELTLEVRGFTLPPGAPPELVAALPALTAPYLGPRRSYDDLVNAAADITRFLQRELGFYLGYAYLPEQSPQDGLIRIEVLEGRLDRIELDWPAQLRVRREVVEAYLARLRPGEILRVELIERVVFLLNDLRGITVRFDVQAGATPGTARLKVSGRPEDPWSGKVDADANGSRFLGLYRVGALLAGNSLAGRGDSLTLNALSSDTGGLLFALLGYSLPVGHDGWKLGSSLSMVRYKLDPAQFPLGVNGDAVSLSVNALYPWRRSRNLNVFMVGNLDNKQHADRQDVARSVQRRSINSLTLGLSGDLRDSLGGGAVSTFEANLAHGELRHRGGMPGGLDDAPRFTKLGLAGNRLQNLVDGRMLLYAALRGQWALDNLDSSEQFRAGGPDGVRAFAPGEGTGDSGVVATLELRLLPPEAWLGRWARELVASVFFDHAALQLRHEPATQAARTDNRQRLGGAGVALSWERPRSFAARLSVAVPSTGQARSDTAQRNPRVYAQLSWFY
ncbi:ShlB/FhaC/HecB family hemolysin secretion/activation protein [Aquabacterium sp. OR-4]|uniref:ShlB/FhaC/HecB family hemolysin secretion/activation protein n=1 Tax=Aquabacterium sp. OR-4 TaxID=2978127 RepID=UPI0028CA4051|nr:ShlB/FhaC/HecB family hemolysin secretion/activation protein [Aquabacterium sp. OR-4]MDT7835510.1 ShlB/FhaC/HecB family hemolysin secretion/activation protein [Aquabacterium sp. OR-4]